MSFIPKQISNCSSLALHHFLQIFTHLTDFGNTNNGWVYLNILDMIEYTCIDSYMKMKFYCWIFVLLANFRLKLRKEEARMNEEERKIADSMILFNELPECLPDDSKERVCLVFLRFNFFNSKNGCLNYFRSSTIKKWWINKQL